MPLFVGNYPPEVNGRGEEIFDLVVFAHHEVQAVVRGGVRREEVGPPSWKGRRAVAVLIRSRM